MLLLTRLTRWGFGGGFAAPSKFSFWLLSGTFVPDSSQKEKNLGGLRPPNLPLGG